MSSDRISYLNDINSFLNSSKSCLSNILSSLNWNEENLLTHKNINKNVSSNFDSKEEGTSCIQPDETFGENSGVKLNEFIDTLPVTIKKEKEKTILEILAQERDLKRRRISYKGRIHTNRKSLVEILREVISQQMEMFEETNDSVCITKKKVSNNSDNKISNDSKLIYDLCNLYSSNPHLAWKHARKEVDSFKNDNDVNNLSTNSIDDDSDEAIHNNFDDKKKVYSRNRDRDYKNKSRRNEDKIDREYRYKYKRKDIDHSRSNLHKYSDKMRARNDRSSDKFTKTHDRDSKCSGDTRNGNSSRCIDPCKLEFDRSKINSPVESFKEIDDSEKEEYVSKDPIEKNSRRNKKKHRRDSESESRSDRKRRKKRKKSRTKDKKKRSKSPSR